MSADQIEAAQSPEEIAALLAAAAEAEAEARAKAQAEAEAAEAEAEREAAARAAEAQAQMQAAAAAALQDEAEAENAERDALAASLAAMAAANAKAKPTLLPTLDTMEAPRKSFGPTFQAELAAAGVHGFHFSVVGSRVIFGGDITADQRAAVVAVIKAHDPSRAEAVDLAAYAKDARDRHETGGITVGGVPVATDDRSKTLLTGARLRVEKDATLVTSFAAADGHVYPLTAPMILAVSDAIGAFVAELFEAYAGIMVDLKAGTITTTQEIDARYGALNVAF